MKPFRVEFTFRTMLVEPTADKTLDAVLSWAAVQRADFAGELDPRAAQHDLPLEREAVDQHWCFKASNIAFEWDESVPRTEIHYTKHSLRTEYADAWMSGLFVKKPFHDGTRGLTKAGLYVHPVRWAKRAVAYGVGDLQKLRALLPWVTHLGKLHSKDYGAVKAWRLDEDATALEMWSKRPLPIGSGSAMHHAPAMGALRSPYWLRETFQEILAPL